MSHILKSERSRLPEYGERQGAEARRSEQVFAPGAGGCGGLSPPHHPPASTHENNGIDRRVAMELSSIGDQVFAVESITKKRVRKVRRRTRKLVFAVFPFYPAGAQRGN